MAPKKGMYSKKNQKVKKSIKYSKKGKKRSFNDVYNYKLQHNSIIIDNVQIGAAIQPQARGSGCETFVTNVESGTFLNEFTGAFLFRLTDTIQWPQLSTLYDRSKINGVKVKFIPLWNVQSPGAFSVIPEMKLVRDYDDANMAQTTNTIWARQGKTFRLDKPFSVFVKPRMRSYVASTPQGGATSPVPAGSVKACYLDTASAGNVPHFGLKFAVRDWLALDATSRLRIRVEITYYCTFKEQIYQMAPKTLEDIIEDNMDDVVEEEQACEIQNKQ